MPKMGVFTIVGDFGQKSQPLLYGELVPGCLRIKSYAKVYSPCQHSLDMVCPVLSGGVCPNSGGGGPGHKAPKHTQWESRYVVVHCLGEKGLEFDAANSR
jgi:hypothetical protein